MTMPEEVKPCNITMTVEVTRPDGPVTSRDIVASLCAIYEALGHDASAGSGDACDGSEYRFQIGDVEGLAANRYLREENHRLRKVKAENEKLREKLTGAADVAAEQAPDVPDDTQDEYRRGQKRGALDAAHMVRNFARRALAGLT